MSNRLNLPQDLEALIEKREVEERRQAEECPRSEERRSGTDRREEETSTPQWTYIGAIGTTPPAKDRSIN